MARRFVAFGELLLRLDAKGYSRFVQAEEFTARYTGAEANVAVSLSGFGWETWAVSKVPEHEIGQACINGLRRHGVNVEHVVRGGERLGLLYLETGASQRPTKVIYDRGHSSFSEALPEEFDWARILEGKDWLHFAGTAPALGPGIVRILEDGLRMARKLGVTVSCDSNYRSKLWSVEEAARVLSGLLGSVDVFIGGRGDAERLFGIAAEPGAPPDDAAAAQARELCRRFGFRAVAMTLREGASASVNRLAGLFCRDGHCHVSRRHEIAIVDRIGGGDAFTAGIIHGLGSGWDGQDVAEFAAAASCLKHSIPGDFNLVTAEEVQDLIRGDGGGRVRR
jgi:2-dehydro-3-deoxygluconokinase